MHHTSGQTDSALVYMRCTQQILDYTLQYWSRDPTERTPDTNIGLWLHCSNGEEVTKKGCIMKFQRHCRRQEYHLRPGIFKGFVDNIYPPAPSNEKSINVSKKAIITALKMMELHMRRSDKRSTDTAQMARLFNMLSDDSRHIGIENSVHRSNDLYPISVYILQYHTTLTHFFPSKDMISNSPFDHITSFDELS